MNAVTPDIDELLKKTKGNLFFQKGAGFLGPLLCKLNFEWVDSPEIQTAAISATTLYWNPTFFLGLDKETRITVLAHELWHNALLHGARLNERDHQIWNEAADHVINNMLQDHGYYMGGFDYLMDPKYKKWSTEDVYDDLMKAGGKPKPNSMGGDVLPMDAAQREIAIANVVAATTTARMTGKAGEIPGETSILIESFLHPKLPWETLLFNFFNALTTEEYSFARPNRRYTDPLIRGNIGRNGLEHLVYFVDVSGSITDQQVVRMNSEVKYIQEQLRPERLTLITFDTKIRDTYEFEADDPFDEIEITGRGGTDLKDCWKYLEDRRPTACIVFTDMGLSIPENPGLPVIWICVDNPRAEVPYGQLVHFSEKTGVNVV